MFRMAVRDGPQNKRIYFHQVVAYILRFSQIFGVLPVSNITSQDVYQIRYQWLSVPTFIAAVFVILNGLEFITVIYMILKDGVSFHTIGTISFFTTCYLEQLMLWRLALKWPQIIQLWHRTEEIFFSYPYRLYGTFNMSLIIKALSGVLLVETFFEHLMYLLNSYQYARNQIEKCNSNFTIWEALYRNERKHLHVFFSSRNWILPILEWTNFSMAYVLAFTDIFIMMISIGVATRIEQIYGRINAVYKKPLPNIFWKEIRNDFLAVKKLVRTLNSNFDGLILASCSYSMYFICLQLFNSFTKSGNTISTIFFWNSLSFVIVRTLFKLFAAAAVHDNTKKILSTIRNVPSFAWGSEVQSFCDQLILDITAFSGFGYFFLTRKFIFSMAATIVTYELVVTDVIETKTKTNETSICFD